MSKSSFANNGMLTGELIAARLPEQIARHYRKVGVTQFHMQTAEGLCYVDIPGYTDLWTLRNGTWHLTELE